MGARFIMVESRARRRPWLASAALLPLLWAGAAIAADETSPAATATTSVSEIVVTATRKEEALSKVPVSVSAFTAAKMEVLEMKTFADVARFTPGVSFDEDSHDISIRGISSTAGSGTTGIYIDDTPVQVRNLGLNANNTLPAVYDLQRVEVLRGPQGTLFGAGSEGGTVRYITTQPSLTTFSGMAHSELAYTQDGAPSYELGAAFGGPIINDTLAFRISAWARRDGGWIDRVNYQTLGVTDADANRADTYVLRAALTWAPIKNLTITPGINYQDRDQHNYNNYWVSISNPSAGMFLNGTPDRMPDADHFLLPTLKIEYDGPVQVISNTAYYNRRELVGGYSGTIYNLSYFQHYLDPNPSLSIFGYPSDPQGVPCTNNCQNLYPLLTATGPNLPGLPNYYSWNTITNAQQNLTQEVRVQSNNPASRLQWVTGVFYAYDTQRSIEEIHDPELPAITQYLWNESVLDAWGENLLPNGDDYINDTRAHDQQIALFADATFAITDQLKAEVGVRYAWTHFDFVNLNDGPQDLLDDGGVPAIVSGSKNERPFTPKGTLTWQATPDDMVYATAAKGYRIGGATPPLPIQACGPGFPDSYNSDSVWSYEIGSKDRFFDRRLQISGSAYYINWSNIQQAFYVPSCGIQFTTNAGQAVSKGFDLQSQWQVTHNFEIELTLGYTDAKFSKTALDANGDVLDVAGDSLDVVPWTATLGAQYNFTMAGREGFIRGDYIFNSKRHTPIPNEDPRTAFYDSGLVPDPATNEVSAKAGLNLGAWDLSIFAENLLNAHPQLNLQHQDSETLLFEAETFRPRTIGVSANYKY
jgi:outer membrane receptor protein involved in Fe transport